MRSTLALLLAGCALAGCSTDRPGVPPGAPPGVLGRQLWQGTLACAPAPGAVQSSPAEMMTISVTGNQATYEHPVRIGPGSNGVGGPGVDDGAVERGSGTVMADGSVVLTGQVRARMFSYTAVYQGGLPPGGRAARLVGSQQVIGAAGGGFTRSCTVDLVGGAPGNT